MVLAPAGHGACRPKRIPCTGVCSGQAPLRSLQPSAPYPRLLREVGVHLLLAEWGHIVDLLVVSLHYLPILRDLLGVQ